MNLEDYKSWLNSLKVGDEIAIRIFHLSRPDTYKLSRITKITPSRMMYVEGDTGRYKDGHNNASGNTLVPYTEGIFDIMDKEVLLRVIETTRLRDLPVEKLREIKKIIES